MSDTAAHLVDRVLPKVPYRQWVLSLPVGLRYHIAYNPRACNDALTIVIRAINDWLRRQAVQDGITNGAPGSVTVIQRFGDGLRVNPHFHILVTDGVFHRPATAALTGHPRFHRTAAPNPDELTALLNRIITRFKTLFADLSDPDRQEDPDQLCLALLNTGPRQLAVGAPPTRTPTPRRRKPKTLRVTANGFDLHAATTVPVRDRTGLEHLCRYLLRPAIPQFRLTLRTDGNVLLKLKTTWTNGATHLLFTPH